MQSEKILQMQLTISSFTIKQGETLGIAGESGLKTTLAKLLLRLIETDSGKIKLNEEDLFTTRFVPNRNGEKSGCISKIRMGHSIRKPVGRQLTEVMQLHDSPQNATIVKNKIIDWFEK